MEEMVCVVCGSKDIGKLFQLYDFWLNRRDIVKSFYVCNNCKLIFQYPIPNTVNHLELYPIEYSIAQQESDSLSRYGLLKRCKVITRWKTPGNILDIGCGVGTFILTMRDNFGWEVHGIEPNPIIAANGREKHNLDIKSEDIQNYDPKGIKFDVITMWDVLEHLPNPNEVFAKLITFLKPDGLLMMRVPNSQSWDAKIFGQYWAGYDSPRHFFVYNPKNLEILLDKISMEIVHEQTNIGSNLNFIKSINFYLTGKNVAPKFRQTLIKILSSVFMRPFIIPFSLIKDINHRGTSVVIIAKRA
ncbi:MAG: class I SAM-dependent methyltransferase [Bellilinea sp.]